MLPPQKCLDRDRVLQSGIIESGHIPNQSYFPVWDSLILWVRSYIYVYSRSSELQDLEGHLPYLLFSICGLIGMKLGMCTWSGCGMVLK